MKLIKIKVQKEFHCQIMAAKFAVPFNLETKDFTFLLMCGSSQNEKDAVSINLRFELRLSVLQLIV